jgi:hypothetical protein
MRQAPVRRVVVYAPLYYSSKFRLVVDYLNLALVLFIAQTHFTELSGKSIRKCNLKVMNGLKRGGIQSRLPEKCTVEIFLPSPSAPL